jgi:serine carboxypeptidase-like clade 1
VNEWVRCHQGDLPYDEDIVNGIEYHRKVASLNYRTLVYRYVWFKLYLHREIK